MRSINRCVLAASAALVFGASVPAQAAGVLDQSNLAGPGGFAQSSPLGVNRQQAQIFTAGITGQLVQVDFQLVSSGQPQQLDFTFLVGGVAALPVGVPASSITFAVPVTAGGFNTVSVDLTSYGFNVVAGQQYGLMLGVSGGTGSANWVFGTDADGDPATEADTVGLSYGGGVNYVRQNLGAWSATGFDRGFQTFVQANAVPEPGTWAMLILGMGVVGGSLRRRQRLIGALPAPV